MKKCESCNNLYEGNFCSNCGRPNQLKRIDRKYIQDEISSVFNLDKGIFLTIKELLIRPGHSIREFLLTDRNRLVKPILFILITSLVYSLINNLFKIEDQYVNYGDLPGTTAKIFIWIQENYGYANIIMSVFIAYFLKLFFRKSKYSIYEILVLLCFIMGMGMLILAFLSFVQGITGLIALQSSGIILMIYITFAIGDFYNEKKLSSYLKVPAAYFIGMIVFFILTILIGNMIDLFLN